jgi:hypothetical protein
MTEENDVEETDYSEVIEKFRQELAEANRLNAISKKNRKDKRKRAKAARKINRKR